MKYSHWLKARTAGMSQEKREGYCLGSADAWQEQQKRIDELQAKLSEDSRVLHNVIDIERTKFEKLQARVDAALQEIKGAARWIDEDAIDDLEFIKGGALRALKRLEQALKGGEV